MRRRLLELLAHFDGAVVPHVLARLPDSPWYLQRNLLRVLQMVPDPRSLERDYRAAIAEVLAEAKLDVPPDQRPILGGRRGHHSEHLGHLLAVMQFLPRTYPDAVW